MNVLRAIGRFFVRIGKWIRDTAWVQPLLIVGGIFALIFAINPTVKWVQSWFSTGDQSEAFYKSKKLSWAGAENKKSAVHDLFSYMENPDSYTGSTKFENKFFVLFYGEDCSGCKSNYDGFSYLQNNFGRGEFSYDILKENLDERDYGTSYEQAIEDSKKLTFYSVDVAEIDESDQKNEMSFFTKYIYGNPNDSNNELPGYNFFQTIVEAENFTTKYLDKTFLNEGNEALCKKWGFQPESSEDFGFYTPTVLMYENHYEGQALEINVSEVLFDYEGEGQSSDAVNKARTIFDCWTHHGDFSRWDN